MKYYTPYFEVELDPKTFMPMNPDEPPDEPQTRLMDKIGGHVWGLPAEKYPICSTCKKPFTFIAQFIHHPERFDLGREGRVMFLFDCLDEDGGCTSGDIEDVKFDNDCFVLEPEELIDELTPLPDPENFLKAGWRIPEWDAEEDDVTDEIYRRLSEGDGLYDILPEDEVDDFDFYNGMRLGSAPSYLQHPPKWAINSPVNSDANWKFLGQIDAQAEVFDLAFIEQEYYSYWGGGIGYIFIRKTADDSKVPECRFFTQCT